MNFLNITLYEQLKRILSMLPDWITGRTVLMQQKYRIIYGQRECSDIVLRNKIKILISYLIICVLLIIGVSSILLDQFFFTDELAYLARPQYNQANKIIPVQVHLRYKDAEIKKNIQLELGRKKLTQKERKEILDQYQKDLKKIILGNNEDLNHIKKQLNLIERDTKNKITLVWETNKPEIIKENGEIDLIKAEKGEVVELNVTATIEDYSEKWSYFVKISPDVDSIDFQDSLLNRLEETAKQIKECSFSGKITLPDKLSDGIDVDWRFSKNNITHFIIIGCLFGLLYTYFTRYDEIDKEIKKAADSITADLPQFIHKLVLLLNAGLVVSTALNKIAEDHKQYNINQKFLKKFRRRRYLYDELSEIQKRVKETNTPYTKELKEFAQRSGVREFVRLTAIISDNVNKGSTLTDKLEAEGELLWLSRKKKAEEKGRLAETKLTLPLVILLMVLIMITIAPALIEM